MDTNDKAARVLVATRGFSILAARNFLRNLKPDEIQKLASMDTPNGLPDPDVRAINAAIDRRLSEEMKAAIAEANPPAVAEAVHDTGDTEDDGA